MTVIAPLCKTNLILAAVVSLPPTLVASIYGMNFDLMPELRMSAIRGLWS